MDNEKDKGTIDCPYLPEGYECEKADDTEFCEKYCSVYLDYQKANRDDDMEYINQIGQL